MEANRFSAPEAADAIEAELRVLGTPERAAGEKRYLKSDLDFLGTTVGQTRRAVRAFARTHPDLGHDQLVDVVEALWSKPVFERRHAAGFLLDAHPALVGPPDLPLIERLVGESGTWALVDVLAGDVLGELLVRHPLAATRLDTWARDPDFWVRRSALLAWLEPLKRGAALDGFLGYADAMLEEKEFFVRKAIGWVLREVGKTRPREVAEWLGPRTGRASGVTVREAVKYLGAADRDAILAAYKAGHRT